MTQRRSLLVAIVAVSVTLRVGAAVWQGNTVTDLPGICDQLSYHGLAQRVVTGHGFSFAEDHWPATRAGEPTAHWSFLYTLFLAAVYALFGVAPVAARVIQAVVAGVLHPWFAWRVGRRLFGDRAGALAAAFSAGYVYFFYYASALLTESFYFVGILWTLDVALRIGDRQSPARPIRVWVELGTAIAVTSLLRQVFLLFTPILFLWIWQQLRAASRDGGGSAPRIGARSLAFGSGVALMVVALFIAPWTIRNYRAFGTFVPLNTNAGFALYWGNHPIHGTRFIPLLPAAGPSYLDLIPRSLLRLNEGALDRALFTEALQVIRAEPGRFVRLSFSRAREYFKFWPSRGSSTVSNVARIASFGVFLPLILYGLWLPAAGGGLRRADERGALALMYLFLLAYAGIHLASWTLIRYRLPVDVVLLLFAGLAASRFARFSRVNRATPTGMAVHVT